MLYKNKTKKMCEHFSNNDTSTTWLGDQNQTDMRPNE
jgi:hypothetical protein